MAKPHKINKSFLRLDAVNISQPLDPIETYTENGMLIKRYPAKAAIAVGMPSDVMAKGGGIIYPAN